MVFIQKKTVVGVYFSVTNNFSINFNCQYSSQVCYSKFWRSDFKIWGDAWLVCLFLYLSQKVKGLTTLHIFCINRDFLKSVSAVVLFTTYIHHSLYNTFFFNFVITLTSACSTVANSLSIFVVDTSSFVSRAIRCQKKILVGKCTVRSNQNGCILLFKIFGKNK